MIIASSTHRFATVHAPILALAATVALFSVPDRAMAQTERSMQDVTYADLDLATDRGQRTLDARIRGAARTVCRMDEVRTGTRIASPQAKACYREALRSARTRVAQALAAPRQGG